MNAKLKTDALDLTSLLNGLVFFSPVSLLVRTTAGISLSQFFILQAIMATMVLLTEIPLGKLTDRIGYKSTLVLYQIALLISRTCLLLAHVSCNYSLFILQAILEGTAASFSSGTQSGYIYIMFSKEHYAEKSAHVANYGTVGFFASTLAYAVLYTLIGIKGLLLATIAANLVAVFTSLKIPKETVQPRSETRQKKNIPYPQLFQQKKIWMLLMILAALNIGRILINFFYAEKLQLCGINETWLAAIIMGYSAIQLLSERILARTKPEHYNQMMALFFILSGIALGVLGLVNVPVWTILFMLILPLFLDIPSYLLGEVQNSIVDAAGREDNRAELLSVFNMGVNVTEIFYLFGSSLLVSAGSTACFVILGAFMTVVGIGICLSVKSAWLLSLQEKRTATNFSLQYQEGLYMMSGYISDCLGENFSCIQPKPILPQKFNWDVFMATLIPTEGCNFQCSYCHKNHPAASMTRDTLDQIEEYITAQAPRHKQVVLAWLGGEPILCKDTVLEVSEMIQNLQKQHGFQYTAKMTTNGYLLDEKLFRQFCQAGITSYQITLDGWNHDKTRPHVSGKGTLRTIIDNLVALSKLPPEEYSFHITLRRNLLAGDEDYSWYDYLYRLFGQDKRFDVLVCAVGDWGGKGSHDLSPLHQDTQEVLVAKHIAYLDKIGMLRYNQMYCVSRPNRLVFWPDGKIGKCTAALNRPQPQLE